MNSPNSQRRSSWEIPTNTPGSFGPVPHSAYEPPLATPRRPRNYYPRTCRICLETVSPTYHPGPESLSGIFNPSPSVAYVSSDPESGRLISPCKCRGSSRYVHEGCLQTWRHADPGYGTRNFWQCPTCGFKYRLERMRWGRWINSKGTQIGLTLGILFLTMFVLGFVADPIINLYLDPYNTITTAGGEPILLDDEGDAGWVLHFTKGLASLGLLSFVKVIFAMSPWHWLNLRNSGLMGGGARGNTGRDRLASLNMIVVIIGVGTFLWGVYKGVSAWSRKALEKAGERVVDVHGDNDEDDEAPEEPGSGSNPPSGTTKEEQ